MVPTLRRLGLQKEMIVLRDEGDPLDVAGPETDEGLPGLELKIRLIADEARESITPARRCRRPCEFADPAAWGR